MPAVDIAVRPYGTPPASADTFQALPEWKPGTAADTGDYSQLPAWQPPEDRPAGPEMGTAEKAWRGVLDSASFGTLPAVEGLGAAAGPEWHQTQAAHDFAPIVGAAKMMHSYLAGHPDDQVRKDYEKGRRKAETEQKEAGKSWAYTTGQVLGGLATPAFGAMKAGGLAARAGFGALGGAVGGGLYGAGSGISAGEEAPNVARQALVNAGIGGLTGGAVGGVLGPRVVNLASPGRQAAATAERLGAPLPRGYASDSPRVQATTAKFAQLPLVGERISERVGKTVEAAGEHLRDVASGMGPTDRATAGAIAQPALEAVITRNKAIIDRSYNAVRNSIDRTARYTMPETDAALNNIMAARQSAGHVDPAQGLAQFRNVAGGTTVEGAMRAKADAANAGRFGSQHPGYDAGDFRTLRTAIDKDLRNMVYTAGGSGAKGNKALAAFDNANKAFGPIKDQNEFLAKLAGGSGESVIGSLTHAAQNIGGNVKLLSQLKRQMNPADFQQIGAVILHEAISNKAAPSGTSLAQFISRWKELSPQAKSILFSPQHQKDIEEIVGMGSHIKRALTEKTTSHSGGMMVLLDVAKDALLIGADVASGGLGAGTAIGAASTAGIYGLATWLGNPAKAAAMSNWTKAYRGITLDKPTPVRIAAFNLATRNLANNLRIPLSGLIDRISRAQPQNQDNQPPTPRVIDQ